MRAVPCAGSRRDEEMAIMVASWRSSDGEGDRHYSGQSEVPLTVNDFRRLHPILTRHHAIITCWPGHDAGDDTWRRRSLPLSAKTKGH
jgi:hypothetical protein